MTFVMVCIGCGEIWQQPLVEEVLPYYRCNNCGSDTDDGLVRVLAVEGSVAVVELPELACEHRMVLSSGIAQIAPEASKVKASEGGEVM